MTLDTLFTPDEEELLFDNALEEDEVPVDGLTRAEELEGLLAAILDYWDEDVLLADVDSVDEVAQLMDRIGVVLANEEAYTD